MQDLNDPWEGLKREIPFVFFVQPEFLHSRDDQLVLVKRLEKYLDTLSVKFISIVDNQLLLEFAKSLEVSNYSSTEIRNIDKLLIGLKKGNYEIIFEKIKQYECIEFKDKETALNHILSLTFPLSEYQNKSDSEKQKKFFQPLARIVARDVFYGEFASYLDLVKNYNLIYLSSKFLVLFITVHILVLVCLPLCLFLSQSVTQNIWKLIYSFFFYMWLYPVLYTRNTLFESQIFINNWSPLLLRIFRMTLYVLILILFNKLLNGESRYSSCMDFLLSIFPLTLAVFIYSLILRLYLHLYLTKFRKYLLLPLDDKLDLQILLTSFLVIAFLSYFPLITYLKGDFIKLLSLPKEQ